MINCPPFRWGLFLLCLSAVIYGNLKPTPPEQVFPHADKAGHGISFIALAISAKLAMYRLHSLSVWSSLILFCFLLEYLQGILRPLRTFSMEDAYANAFGVLIALVVITAWRYFAPTFFPGTLKSDRQ